MSGKIWRERFEENKLTEDEMEQVKQKSKIKALEALVKNLEEKLLSY